MKGLSFEDIWIIAMLLLFHALMIREAIKEALRKS
jgi:hypothetical protein